MLLPPLAGVLLLFVCARQGTAQGMRFDHGLRQDAAAFLPVSWAEGTPVTICSDRSCVFRAPIFLDEALTQPAANPLPADRDGHFGFWIAPLGHGSAPYAYRVRPRAGKPAETYAFAPGMPQTDSPAGLGMVPDLRLSRSFRLFATDLNQPPGQSGQHQVSNVIHVLTRRGTDQNDSILTAAVTTYVEHGWVNADNREGFPVGQTMNVASIEHTVTMNTDGQIGDLLGLRCNHFGKGDCVGLAMDLIATGVNRGSDEGSEPLRIVVNPNGQVPGFRIASAVRDGMGQTILVGPRAADGSPVPSYEGHSSRSVSENALLIDTAPEKAWTRGNVQTISTCPASVGVYPFPYVCLAGDSGTAWTERFGVTRSSRLTMTIPLDGVLSCASCDKGGKVVRDRFADGPIAVWLHVTDASGFKAGQVFAISTAYDDFEMPAALAVCTQAGPGCAEANTVQAYLAKPHQAGALVTTGGGVGYAINFVADNVAPGEWAGLSTHNDATYRLAWPIIATLPGNYVVTEQFPYNQAGYLGTRAFASLLRQPNLPDFPADGGLPAFTPVVRNGEWIASEKVDVGNATPLLPAGSAGAGGLTMPPLPLIRFSGGHCRVQPAGHYGPANGQGAFFPLIDEAGAGCDSTLTATTTENAEAYRNPYEIHPAAWIRSVYDPTWSMLHPDNVNGPFTQPDPNHVVTPATANYYALDGSADPAGCPGSAAFCPGDTVEQVYDMHQQQISQMNFFRQVYSAGTTGSIVNFNFRGHGNGDSLLAVSNQDPDENFYGNKASGYYPDGRGKGATVPPVGIRLNGAMDTSLYLAQPPAGGNGAAGTVIRIDCNPVGDKTVPCANGAWWPYSFVFAKTQAGSVQMRFDPLTGVLRYETQGRYESRNGSFPGLETSLVGRTQAQSIVLGGAAAAGGGGSLYLLNGTETPAMADSGAAGCVLAETSFRCGTGMTVSDKAGWGFDRETPVAFGHVARGTAPAAGDRSDAIPTTAWVASALAGDAPAGMPSGVLGAGAGGSAGGLAFAGGNDSFQVSFTAEGAPAGGAALLTVAFSHALPAVRTCLVNGGNDAAMASPVYAKAVSAGGLTLWVPAMERLTPGTAYVYTVQCR